MKSVVSIQIMSGEDMEMLDYLEAEAAVRRTIDQETKDFKKRQERADKAHVAEYKGANLVGPYSEVGVLAMMAQLALVEPTLFPFTILDYDTHSGYDVLVKGDATTPIQNALKLYVEYKFILTSAFNHSFQNLRSIVCWNTKLQQDDEVQDIAQKKRVLKSSHHRTRKKLERTLVSFWTTRMGRIRLSLSSLNCI